MVFGDLHQIPVDGLGRGEIEGAIKRSLGAIEKMEAAFGDGAAQYQGEGGLLI